MRSDVFERLASAWPSPLVARSEVGRFSGGLLTPRYLANLDCRGEGPSGRFYVGRKVCYPVYELVEWIQSRAVVPGK